ncbi:MAG: phage terminase large subunit [Bacteroidales bacterium]|nr:phage terminase large subunit [Bacteroidales bacterium]
MAKGLQAPKNLVIDFKPSPRQYELWKMLQPDYCPHCGGHIIQVRDGVDEKGNPRFVPQCDTCGTRDLPQLILGGGAAGGGKSYLGSAWLVSSCIRFPDIRAVVARKTLKILKGSTFNTIKKVCKEWGLKEGVNYKINNLEGILTFWNDSVIIMQEMVDLPSDPDFQRFGSNEYTIAFVDEVSEISERAVEVLFSRLRWKTAETFKTARLFMSTNPCLTWVRSRFVMDKDGNPVKCRQGEAYLPFSVFDNPDDEFVRTYVAGLNRISDPAIRNRLLFGNWDFIDTNDAAAYWNFRGQDHLVDHLRESVYNPLKPIISSWDFNVIPRMSTLSMQIDYENKKVYVLEEILGEMDKKENNTPALSRKVAQKYLNENHLGGLLVTGDPAGLARSTQTEEGVNNFTIILDNLNAPSLNARKKLLSKQPPHVTRLEFVNALFNGYDGWEIKIDMRCRRFTEDLIYQRKNSDGTKAKTTATDPKTKVKYEKYGHLSDCFDYVLVLFLADSWAKFKRKDSTIETTAAPIYGGFEY